MSGRENAAKPERVIKFLPEKKTCGVTDFNFFIMDNKRSPQFLI